MILIPPVLLLMMLPISVGGWGVRELSMVGFLGYAGVSSEAALEAFELHPASDLVGWTVPTRAGGKYTRVLWSRVPMEDWEQYEETEEAA